MTDDGLLLIVPPGTEVWGNLPPSDLPHARARSLERCPVVILLPHEHKVTVKWQPDGFRCALAAFHDEAHPLEDVTVATVDGVRCWLAGAIARL